MESTRTHPSRSRIDLTHWLLWPALAFAAYLGLGAAAAAEPSIEEIETAHRMGDISELSRLAERANEGIAGSNGDDQTRARYALALISWRSNHLWNAETDRELASTDQLEIARRQLETILEIDPTHVEALALRSAVLGELSEASLLSRIRLGAAALRSLDRAEEIEPDNPRVALQRGVFTLHTPGFAGGGPEAALPQLERARELFDAQAQPASWPNWGRVDAAAWLGQTLARLDRVAEARARYEEGLSIAPPSPWILYTLLPELDTRFQQ